MRDEEVLCIGVVGRLSRSTLDAKSHLALLNFIADLFFKNLHVVVTDIADGSNPVGARWAEESGRDLRTFAEPLPSEELGDWAYCRALKARRRRFIERCDCVYMVEKKGWQARFVKRCCRRRGIECFVF